MATKQIPFNLEMVKKIQAGEVKGTIRTRDGRAARFLGEVCNNIYPLVFVYEVSIDEHHNERALNHTINGFYFFEEHKDDRDIILEIEDEQKKPEHQFKPFDKVLVRNEDDEIWDCNLFSLYRNGVYWCVGDVHKQCIPYEGNEHLLGTTNKPKEE